MDNYIIIGIIAVIIVICAVTTIRRVKSKSCCSGSGSRTLVERKNLTEPVIMRKTVRIEGMHCENCSSSVERHINRLDGAVCKVNLKKHIAEIQLSRNISDEEISNIITSLDFTVSGIETKEI